jgi:hypothetical protein
VADSVELIPYNEFARLRLALFYPDASELVPLENWEFMGSVWVGEADGFTEFLRPEEKPDELGSIEIDLSSIQEDIGAAILDKIHLPLQRGMLFEQVAQHLGPPESTDAFVSDRKTYNFTLGSISSYCISCTVHESEGLIHVTVIRRDLLRDNGKVA